MTSVHTQQLVEEAIESFDFPGPLKGINDHDEHEWIEDLAAHVIRALESDPRKELA